MIVSMSFLTHFYNFRSDQLVEPKSSAGFGRGTGRRIRRGRGGTETQRGTDGTGNGTSTSDASIRRRRAGNCSAMECQSNITNNRKICSRRGQIEYLAGRILFLEPGENIQKHLPR